MSTRCNCAVHPKNTNSPRIYDTNQCWGSLWKPSSFIYQSGRNTWEKPLPLVTTIKHKETKLFIMQCVCCYFTRQTNVGQLTLEAHIGVCEKHNMLAKNRTCLQSRQLFAYLTVCQHVVVSFTPPPVWVCQQELANINLIQKINRVLLCI